MASSLLIGSLDDAVDAPDVRCRRSLASESRHSHRRRRRAAPSSVTFAHITGISDKLQHMASELAADDAVDKSNMELQRWKAAATEKRTMFNFQNFRWRCRNLVPFGVVDAYRGVGAAFFGTIPVALIYFAVYEHSKTRLANSNSNIPASAQALLAQSVAALSSAVVRVPTDTIRHRVQAYLHPNWASAVPQIVKSKGFRGFYAGFTPTVIRDVPELVLQFTIYEGLRRVVQRFNGEKKLDTGFHLLLGGTAGALSAIFSTPLDVVKTTMQCGGKDAMKQGVLGIMKAKYNQNPALLFNGLGPRMCQEMVKTAIFFTLFELFKHQLKPSSMRVGDDRELLPKLYGKRRERIWKRQFTFQ